MNNKFSLQQSARSGNLDSNLISRQYELKLMADFMRIKYENPQLKQSETANQLSYSSRTLQRYRNDINMLSLYRIRPNNINKRTKKTSNSNFDNYPHREPEVKRLKMTSNDVKTTQTNTKSNKKNKNILRAGSVHDNVEINGLYLDEILHKKPIIGISNANYL